MGYTEPGRHGCIYLKTRRMRIASCSIGPSNRLASIRALTTLRVMSVATVMKAWPRRSSQTPRGRARQADVQGSYPNDLWKTSKGIVAAGFMERSAVGERLVGISGIGSGRRVGATMRSLLWPSFAPARRHLCSARRRRRSRGKQPCRRMRHRFGRYRRPCTSRQVGGRTQRGQSAVGRGCPRTGVRLRSSESGI
jgi:hypothetical protein